MGKDSGREAYWQPRNYDADQERRHGQAKFQPKELSSVRVFIQMRGKRLTPIYHRGVTSMRAQNIGLPAVFRSYRVRANAGIDCAIWEVLRATTAAPLLFKSVFIGRKWAKQEFINAELGANNPISYLFQEKQKVWLRKDNWPPPEIGCVISVGSGKDSVISLPSEPEAQTGWTRWFRSKPDFDLAEKLYGVMLRIAKDCERKHQEVEATYGPEDEKVYFRLNVEQGMQDLPENTYDEETRVKIKAQVAQCVSVVICLCGRF